MEFVSRICETWVSCAIKSPRDLSVSIEMEVFNPQKYTVRLCRIWDEDDDDLDIHGKNLDLLPDAIATITWTLIQEAWRMDSNSSFAVQQLLAHSSKFKVDNNPIPYIDDLFSICNVLDIKKMKIEYFSDDERPHKDDVALVKNNIHAAIIETGTEFHTDVHICQRIKNKDDPDWDTLLVDPLEDAESSDSDEESDSESNKSKNDSDDE